MTEFFDDDQDEETKKKSSEFAKLLEDSFKSTRKSLKPGDRIYCEVLSIGKDEAFVSTGTMYDGLVRRKELMGADGSLTVQVGDSIQLYVTSVRGSEIHLSPSPTAKNLADDLEDAFDKMLPIEGVVAEVCKGGFRVKIRGQFAFCPISQMDQKRIDTPENYVGQRFEFLITQFSEGGRNIVVSRRKLLDEQKGLSESAFLEEKKAGDLLKGTVTRIEKYGAFIELESGVEGLAHISELSWSRVSDPHEVLSVGQVVHAKVLKMEEVEGRLRVALSIKQAELTPWERLPEQIQVGSVVEGKVTRCMKFGAFVEIHPGVEGLVPLSEMSYTKRVVRSDELFKEGDRISVMIKEIHSDQRRMLLSLKDAGSDPWALVEHKFPVGTVVQGTVERREPYGLFIQLTEGVVGLLPKGKALEDPQFPYDKLKLKDTVMVQVAELKLEERRISLATPKDADAEDWKQFSASQSASSGSFGTLGDQLRSALEKKKKSSK